MDQNLTRCGVQDACKHFDRRRLSRPIRSNIPDELAGFNLETDIANGLFLFI
ncbi:hypothetical protein D3C86_2139290 [compost metagenome]